MKYRAFISYSRKDARIAKRLHRALERFRLPSGIPGVDAKRRLGRFFRDDDELRASEHLGAALDGAIDDSKDLIVIASQDAARSTWVDKEIRRFRRRSAARVFAVIVRGRPNSDDVDTECFPPALKFKVADEVITTDRADPPLAVDLTAERFARAFIRLVAGLLDVEFDALWRRERRRVRYRRAIVGASIAMGLATAILSASHGVTMNDMAALRDRSVEISTEQWRYFREGSAFEPAFRAALAAARLDRPDPGEHWALNVRSNATSRAIALSGHALPMRRLFGKYPDTATRGNYRDDIPNEDPAQRVAVRAEVTAHSLGFSGDSKWLGVTISDGQVLVFDVLSGAQRYSGRFEDVDAGSSIALDELGRTALVGTRTGFQVVDTDSGASKACATTELQRFHEIGRLANQWVFTAAQSGGDVVGSFDPESCQITRRAEIPEFTPYNSHAFSTGATLFVGFNSSRGLTPVLGGFHSAPSVTFDGLGDGVGQVKVIATEATRGLVALGGNGSGGGERAGVQIVSLERRAEVSRLIGHTGEVYAVDFMPATDLIVTGGSDFSIRLWEVGTGNELIRLAGHLGDIYDARFSPDGNWLATSSSDGTVLLWNVSPVREFGRRPLWELTSERKASSGVWPSTVVTLEEREVTPAFQGRPWDVLEWHDPSTVLGAVQSVRAMVVRWFGWSRFDYSPPDTVAASAQADPAPSEVAEQPRLNGEEVGDDPHHQSEGSEAATPTSTDLRQSPSVRPAEEHPVRYAGYVSGFGLSESAAGPESAISWNEVDAGRFLHIHVLANLPPDITVLQGKCRKVTGMGIGDRAHEFDLPSAKRITGEFFDFIIDHHRLQRNTTYLIRVSDDFSSKDSTFVTAHTFRTKE